MDILPILIPDSQTLVPNLSVALFFLRYTLAIKTVTRPFVNSRQNRYLNRQGCYKLSFPNSIFEQRSLMGERKWLNCCNLTVLEHICDTLVKVKVAVGSGGLGQVVRSGSNVC